MRVNVEIEYPGYGSAQSGGSPPGTFRKSFTVDGWGRTPMAGEYLRLAEGNAPVIKIAGVTFGIDGSVSLWPEEVDPYQIERAWLEQNGWQES